MNVEGSEAIYQQMKDAFSKLGIKEIEAVGKQFNPNLHNAIMYEEDSKNKHKNIITEEFQKGYKIGDKVIRPSLVKVVN